MNSPSNWFAVTGMPLKSSSGYRLERGPNSSAIPMKSFFVGVLKHVKLFRLEITVYTLKVAYTCIKNFNWHVVNEGSIVLNT